MDKASAEVSHTTDLPSERITSARSDGPLVWTAIVLACAVVSAIVVFGKGFHLHQNSDALVPVFVSLQRWTPFFWEQNRVGMLIPLLALPFRNPLQNLLVQDALNVVYFCLTLFLLAAYVVRHRVWMLAAAVSAAAFLVLLSPDVRFLWFVPLGFTAPFWGLLGLLLLERESARSGKFVSAAALVLLVIGSWTNATAPLYLAPVVLFRYLLTGRPRRVKLSLVLVAVSFVIGFGLMRIANTQATQTGILSPMQWPHGWAALGYNSAHALYSAGARVLLLPGAALLGIAASLVSGQWRKPEWRTAFRGTLALLAAGAVYWLWVATQQWTKTNDYDWRYVSPSLIGFIVVLSTWAVLPLCTSRVVVRAKPVVVIASFLIVGSALVSYGWPSLSCVAADLQTCCGRLTPDVVASKPDILIGDYWVTYPAAFHANMTFYRTGVRHRVLVISDKATGSRNLWEPLVSEKCLIAARKGDRRVEHYSDRFRVPLSFEKSLGTIDLFRSTP